MFLSLRSHQGEIQRLDRVPRSGPDRLQDGTGQPAGGGECVHTEDQDSHVVVSPLLYVLADRKDDRAQ